MISVPMRERYAPSRPRRLVQERRFPSPSQMRRLTGSGDNQSGQRFLTGSVPRLERHITAGKDQKPVRGSERQRARGRAPRSLDTQNQLATSVANWMKDQETARDKYQKRVFLWRQLCATVYSIWQDAQWKITQSQTEAEKEWRNSYDTEREALKSDRCPGYDAWLDDYVKKNGLPACAEVYLHSLYLKAWQRKYKPVDGWERVLRWENQYFQLYNCQGELILYKASCCEERTEPNVVPIGCNHRLCPLCNWQRSENAKLRIRKLFDGIENPQFLTLTVGSTKKISKRTFEHIRDRVRSFIQQHKQMFRGGVYAIETTYNRKEKSWHPHVHILMDASYALPSKEQFVVVNGRRMLAFTFVKRSLEYDWTRLWVKQFGKNPRKNAARTAFTSARADFEVWLEGTFENALKMRVAGRSVPIYGLSFSEQIRRRAWNIANRRVVDIRPVQNRDEAAEEVLKETLKYITKSVNFADMPDCVEAFCDATRGVRMIQTFGTWYGIDFSTDFDTRHPEDWSRQECSCGVNHWERAGVLSRRDVEMDEDGRWHPKRSLKQFSWSVLTVPRSTIPALQAPEQRTGDR